MYVQGTVVIREVHLCSVHRQLPAQAGFECSHPYVLLPTCL